MKRPGKIGTMVGAIAVAIAVIGLSLATVEAQQAPNNPPPPDKMGQGVSVATGF